MPSSELEGQVALVTGGGRGIGANIARELASAGMDVWVSGPTAGQVDSVAAEIGGHALVGDVSRRADVERWAGEAGALDLLVCNAGISGPDELFPEPDDWWRTRSDCAAKVFA
jgi:NAD(P)-dependent dehydrogenase (short-subunit alcohol dehydrogenase family)